MMKAPRGPGWYIVNRKNGKEIGEGPWNDEDDARDYLLLEVGHDERYKVVRLPRHDVPGPPGPSNRDPSRGASKRPSGRATPSEEALDALAWIETGGAMYFTGGPSWEKFTGKRGHPFPPPRVLKKLAAEGLIWQLGGYRFDIQPAGRAVLAKLRPRRRRYPSDAEIMIREKRGPYRPSGPEPAKPAKRRSAPKKRSATRRDRPVLSGVDLDRVVMDEELYEFAEDFIVSPFHVSLPGYLKPIAADAGVDLTDLWRMMQSRQDLEKRGVGGGAAAERAASGIVRFVRELREQVKNASIGQVRGYAAARSRWIDGR